jgi:hypothetical protein
MFHGQRQPWTQILGSSFTFALNPANADSVWRALVIEQARHRGDPASNFTNKWGYKTNHNGDNYKGYISNSRVWKCPSTFVL